MSTPILPLVDSTQQYLRDCRLLVSTAIGEGLDLSELRIRFSTKHSDTMTPNSADIRVYNLAPQTAVAIRDQFTRVILQAGYQGNSGVIFDGNIKQVIMGRESSTDTFIDIVAGDGDLAYNYAVVNTTLAKGSIPAVQAAVALKPMAPLGVTPGYVNLTSPSVLPRGKVMYGNSRDILRQIASSNGLNWSIQNGQVNFVPIKSYLPGEAVILTSKTGMIGTPQQTSDGVNVKCLLNPFLKTSGRIQLDNSSIEQLKINLSVPASSANFAPPLTADGVYYILVVEHTGDTRGNDWYSNLVCLSVDITSNPMNSVQAGG